MLDAGGRRALARQMFDHVLDTLREAGIKSVHVASGDGRAISTPTSPLPPVACRPPAPPSCCWVMADLPYLAVDDITAMIDAGRTSAVVIAEAKDGGTNALLLRPPTALGFAFTTGRPSGAFHADQARTRGIEPAFVETSGPCA